MNKPKKTYQKPRITKVALTVEDAVLQCCKTSQAIHPAGSKRNCSSSQCVNSPTNLT